MVCLLLNGPPGSGKDAVARVLCREFGFELYKFADPLRDLVEQETQMDFDNAKADPSVEIEGMSVRDYMIDVSERIIKREVFGGQAHGFFGAHCALRVLASKDRKVVISDAGFQEEVAAFCHVVWSANQTTELWLYQVHRPFHDFSGDSREWTSLAGIPLFQIFNSGSLAQLEANARIIGEEFANY